MAFPTSGNLRNYSSATTGRFVSDNIRNYATQRLVTIAASYPWSGDQVRHSHIRFRPGTSSRGAVVYGQKPSNFMR